MILTKTPLRISFAGGGSDYFHNNLEIDGKVVVTSINKYIYTIFNNRYDKNVRASYSLTENVSSSTHLKHQLIRETLKYFNFMQGVEVVTSADIPSSGSGLGSSSALIVGLVNALYGKGKISNKKIAEIACEIEINKCKKPIGFQDQYSTCFGGLNSINFSSNKKIKVEKIKLTNNRKENFKSNLMLFYTGINRKADKILKKIVKSKKHKINHSLLASLANNFEHELKNGDLMNCGKILHENWMIKKDSNSLVSPSKLDEIYDTAIENGAIGGKLLGAGGGGYFLFFVEKKNQEKIKRKLNSLQYIPFEFENEGTRKFLF
jgi:D-glycero-alpha-D-manno-heptose-7-phosphate kinase